MSTIDKSANKNNYFTDKDDEKTPEKTQKILEINKNTKVKILRRIAAGTKVSLTRKNSSSVNKIRNTVSAVSVKKAKLWNKNFRKYLIETTDPPSKAKKRSLSRQSTIFTPKIMKKSTSVHMNSTESQSRVRKKKIFPVHNKLIDPPSKARKRNLSSQSTVSTRKNKKTNTSAPRNSALSSRRTQAKILPVTKLRSSSKISDIRRTLSSLENSIERHNSRSCKAKSSNENQSALKHGNSSVKESSSQESKGRKISKVRITIKKSTTGKDGTAMKKNQQSKHKNKQKGKEKKVTKGAQKGKKRLPKNKVKYLITIHPIGKNSHFQEVDDSQYEEVDLTTNREHPIQSEHCNEFIAESVTYATAPTSEMMGEDSNMQTILTTTSSNSLTINESNNVDNEIPDSEANAESRLEAEIQIESKTDPQTDSPRVSSLSAESQIQLNSRKASLSLSENVNRNVAANIRYERAKSLNIYTQRDSPRITRIINDETDEANNDTEESNGQNLPVVTEAQNQQNSIQNIISASKSRKISFENVPRFPNQTPIHEHRIRTRCIKPKELKRRMPGQTIGPSWYRYLYRALYGTEEDE